MRFKLFGTEIYISFLFAAIITAMLAIDRTGFLLPTLFAIFMHESGHLFAMWVLGCAPNQIRLVPASVQIVRRLTSRVKSDIIIAACGPVLNIVLFLALYINYLSFHNTMTLYYALINLLVGLFNLLPVAGLDGGTILFNILARKHDVNRALLVVRIITLVAAATALFMGVFLALRGKINISLFIIGIYFLVMNLIKM